MVLSPSHSNAVPYEHQILGQTKDQIRLVKLILSPNADNSIHGVIEIFDLVDAPPFLALSYMWGPATPKHYIFIDGKQLVIRENLFLFLDQYRKLDGLDQYIWIDQICIDQSNISERNHQVWLMGNIYSKSSLVIIWLGLGYEMYWSKTIYELAQRLSHSDDLDSNAAAESVAALLQNAYFSRLWVVQEILLASDIKVLVRDIWVSWKDMIRVNDLGSRGYFYRGMFRFKRVYPGAHFLLQESMTTPQFRRWIDLLHAFGKYKCEDPRDKVYGLMGLVAPGNRLVVDYKRSLHHIFAEVILKCMAECHEPIPRLECYFMKDMETDWDYLYMIGADMGVTEVQRLCLLRFFEVIWTPEKLDRFANYPFPVTAMGFESGGKCEITDRWWYDFGDKRYYFNCDSISFDPETNPVLFDDWAVYVPMEEKRRERVQ